MLPLRLQQSSPSRNVHDLCGDHENRPTHRDAWTPRAALGIMTSTKSLTRFIFRAKDARAFIVLRVTSRRASTQVHADVGDGVRLPHALCQELLQGIEIIDEPRVFVLAQSTIFVRFQ